MSRNMQMLKVPHDLSSDAVLNISQPPLVGILSMYAVPASLTGAGFPQTLQRKEKETVLGQNALHPRPEARAMNLSKAYCA